MTDHANKYFLQRSLMMKMQFPKRKRGQKSIASKIASHFENFFYHLYRGKNPIEAWGLAKKTFN